MYQHEYNTYINIYRLLPSDHIHHVLSSESRHRPGQQIFGPRKRGHRSCNPRQSVKCATLTTAEATPTTPLSSRLRASSHISPASKGCAHTWATAYTQAPSCSILPWRLLVSSGASKPETRKLILSVSHASRPPDACHRLVGRPVVHPHDFSAPAPGTGCPSPVVSGLPFPGVSLGFLICPPRNSCERGCLRASLS